MHVIFHETHFPYQLTNDIQKSPNNLSLPLPPNYDSNVISLFRLHLILLKLLEPPILKMLLILLLGAHHNQGDLQLI